MENFIEKLYYGKTEAQEWDPENIGDFSLLMDSALSCKARLKEAVCDEEAVCEVLPRLDDYTAAWEAVLTEACKNSFVAGFRHGAGFCRDAFLQGD